jgi:hypothetical protein
MKRSTYYLLHLVFDLTFACIYFALVIGLVERAETDWTQGLPEIFVLTLLYAIAVTAFNKAIKGG